MKNKLLNSGYTFDSQFNIYARPNFQGTSYSDGDEIEEDLANIIKQANDLSIISIELRQQCIDWAKTYHLHPNRSNLLRPIENYLKGDVLEIGCGCGAISRFLGENGANVLSLEGSLRRASIAASRTRDLPNVVILAENFCDFKCDHKFDAITFIGVLEYARKFSIDQTEDGIESVLKLARSYLKPDGVLIVAIENQLGLKYFAGFPEDHFYQPMYGIEDLYDINSIVTFGRKELGDRVYATGLTQHEWWFPFPDYKLPTLLVSEAGVMPMEGFDLQSLAKSASSNDMQYPKYVNFMQERALGPVIKNNLLPEMANSFLLVASFPSLSKNENLPLAVHYATDRKPEFFKKVIFEKSEQGIFSAKPVSLYPKRKREENSPLIQKLDELYYVKGEVWQDKLFNLLTKPGWNFQDLQLWFTTWYEEFCKNANISSEDDVSNLKVSGDLFDAIPRNLIIDNQGQAVFIDQEWIYKEKLEVSYIVFRALLVAFSSIRHVALPSITLSLNWISLIKALMKSKNILLQDHQIESFIQQELTMSFWSKGYKTHTYAELMNWLRVSELFVLDTHVGLAKIKDDYECLNQLMLVRQNQITDLHQTLGERDNIIASLDQKLGDRDNKIAELSKNITILINSKSWKLTKPLRFFMRTVSKLKNKLI